MNKNEEQNFVQPSSSFIDKQTLINIKINSVKQYSIAQSLDEQAISAVFLFEKEIVALTLKGDEKTQYKIKNPSSKLILCKLFLFPEKRIIVSSRKELYIQAKPSSLEFTLIGQLAKGSPHVFSNVFFNPETKTLFILIDGVLLVKFLPLVEPIDPLGIQKIIEAREKESSSHDIKKEASLIDDFKEFAYKEESFAKSPYKVAYNTHRNRQCEAIEAIALFTKKVNQMAFKPHSHQFIVCHENEILIFAHDSNFVCVKRITFQLNNLMQIEYSSDGKFILVSLDDNYVYGISDRDNRCVFCLEAHKSFVSHCKMRKVEVPLGTFEKINNNGGGNVNRDDNDNSNTAPISSSSPLPFKEIGFGEYLQSYSGKLNQSRKGVISFSSKQAKEEEEENGMNALISNGNKPQELYELITVGADGLIGLWHYKTNALPNEFAESVAKAPWESTQIIADCTFIYPSPTEIKLAPALTSKNYLRLMPLELTPLVSRPLIELFLLADNSLFTAALRGKNSNKVFITLLRYQINRHNNPH